MNNWYVITGAPSSGKTTIIKRLEEKGYHVVHETATQLIEQELQKGLTLDDIRKDEISFQRKILDMKIINEKALNPENVVFLDRGIPDTLAYYNFLHLPVDLHLEEAVRNAHYKKVFLLEDLEFEKDHIRMESKDEANEIGRINEDVYTSLHFSVTRVPKLSIEDRVQFILNNI